MTTSEKGTPFLTVIIAEEMIWPELSNIEAITGSGIICGPEFDTLSQWDISSMTDCVD